jgi:hypothetical protein
MFGWETEKEKILRRSKIPAEKKLEGIRLMNEFVDQLLTDRQKKIRRKLKEMPQVGHASPIPTK